MSAIRVKIVSCNIRMTSVSHFFLFIFVLISPPQHGRAHRPLPGMPLGAFSRPDAPGALCSPPGGSRRHRKPWKSRWAVWSAVPASGGGRCCGARRRPCRRRAPGAAQGGHLGGAAASGRAAEGRGDHQVALLGARPRGSAPPIAPPIWLRPSVCPAPFGSAPPLVRCRAARAAAGGARGARAGVACASC